MAVHNEPATAPRHNPRAAWRLYERPPTRDGLPHLGQLQSDLVALQSPDMDTRCAAFGRLRYVPKSYLEAGWKEVRAKRPMAGRSFDCLQRVQVTPPVVPIRNRYTITTIISPGYEPLLDQLLYSLRDHGQIEDVAIVVFVVDGAGERAREHDWRDLDLHFIDCQAIERTSAAIKGAIYSCARWIDSEIIVSLEADMTVVGSLQPLFAMLEQCHETALAGCRAQCVAHRFDLGEVLGHWNSPVSDLEFLSGRKNWNAPFSFNGGLLAGHRAAWQELDETIGAMMPFAGMFVEGGMRAAFTDEYVMNVAAAMMENRLELQPTWNVQFFDQERDNWLETERTAQGMKYTRLGQTARILHFLGAQRGFLWDVQSEIENYGVRNDVLESR